MAKKKTYQKTRLGQEIINGLKEAAAWQKGWNAGYEAGLEKGSKLVVKAVTGKEKVS